MLGRKHEQAFICYRSSLSMPRMALLDPQTKPGLRRMVFLAFFSQFTHQWTLSNHRVRVEPYLTPRSLAARASALSMSVRTLSGKAKSSSGSFANWMEVVSMRRAFPVRSFPL